MSSDGTVCHGRPHLGRARELDAIGAALDGLGAGRGALVLVTGEPGIGKTRLADEACRVAAARGLAPACWGRAWEAGGAPSYWPFVQVLRALARAHGTALAAELGHEQRAALAELLPELRTGIVPLGRASNADDRFQLFDAVACYLDAAAALAPRVIVLDDLHAADPSTLLLLQFLVRDLRARPLLVIGTYREAEARLVPEVAPALARIARDAIVLPLARLARGDVHALAQATLGAAVSVAQLDALHRASEGNPLFVHELLRLPDAAAAATLQADRLAGIGEVVRARLALIAPTTRAVLEVAAVLGREFALDPLASIVRALGHTSGPDLAASLRPAVDAAIVEPLDQLGRWRFTHVLLREGLYVDLAAPVRARLHRAAAAELARRVGGPPLWELAHHLLHATPEVPLAEAADAVLAAAEHAMDLRAYEHASSQLERTATLFAAVATADDDARHGDVLLALGLARMRTAEVERGRDACLAALALARGSGDGRRFARAVLGSVYEFAPGVRDEATIVRLEEALAGLPRDETALRARCLVQLAAARMPEPDPRESLAFVHEAIALARASGDRACLRTTLAVAGLAMIPSAPARERVAVGAEALRLAQAAGDRLTTLRSHLFLLAAYWSLGDRANAEHHAREHEKVAATFRHPRFQWVLHGVRAFPALLAGRFDEVEAESAALDASIGADAARGSSYAGSLAGLCRARERYDDVEAAAARARERLGALGSPLSTCLAEMIVAQLLAYAGDRAGAEAQLAIVRALPVFAHLADPTWLALLAMPCFVLGDVALAAALEPALASRGDEVAFAGPTTGYVDVPYALELARLARVLGRDDEAVARYERALALMTGMGAKSQLARAQVELAQALLARAAAGDATRAHALLVEAQALAAALDQRRVLELVAETHRTFPTPVHETPPRPSPGPPSSPVPAPVPAPTLPPTPLVVTREGELWCLTFGGRSARLRDSRGMQVLARLVASPGQELHVLQLAADADGSADAGDAGPQLDAPAVQAYRRRLAELREAHDEAAAFNDLTRAERARREIDALTHELARALGLGDRPRHAGASAERARTAVQKRLKGTVERVAEVLPELARHLDHALQTGTTCAYFPEGRPRGRR